MTFKYNRYKWAVYPNLDIWDMSKDLIKTFLYKREAMIFMETLERSVSND